MSGSSELASHRLVRIHLVYATWCPHCHPLADEALAEFAEDRGLALRRLDIDDPDQEREADRLVKEHGDWSEDYLIPQVFFEFADGTIQHVFTGHSEGVSVTRERLEALLEGGWARTLTSAAG